MAPPRIASTRAGGPDALAHAVFIAGTMPENKSANNQSVMYLLVGDMSEWMACDVDMAYIECMSATRLTTSDRAFFSALGEVVFGNPFSDARDAQIVRLAPD